MEVQLASLPRRDIARASIDAHIAAHGSTSWPKRDRALRAWPSSPSSRAKRAIFPAAFPSPVAFPSISYGFYPVYAQLLRLPYTEVPLREGFVLDPADY